jgi:hypothetical protein
VKAHRGRWTEATPVSLQREAQERSRRDPSPAGNEARRPAEAPPPRPVRARPDGTVRGYGGLTAQELRNIAELSQSMVVRNRKHERRQAQDDDLAGEPCICGPAGPCALHDRILGGRRRHNRPA